MAYVFVSWYGIAVCITTMVAAQVLRSRSGVQRRVTLEDLARAGRLG